MGVVDEERHGVVDRLLDMLERRVRRQTGFKRIIKSGLRFGEERHISKLR